MKILHISDIHMGTDNEENQEIPRIIKDALLKCKKNNLNIIPDVLVVTGDFTKTGAPIEYNEAQKILKQIFESLDIQQSMIVPGNHDYVWRENGQPVNSERKSINYGNFMLSCIVEGICKDNEKELPENLAQDLKKYSITHIYYIDNFCNVLIIGMNSVVLDSEDRAGQGYFSFEQHKVCEDLITYYKEQNREKKLIIIAAFHHHILPVASVERDTLKKPEKFSLTLDARRTLNFFVDNNVRLAIHGHQHQPSIVYWGDEMRETDCLYVISAGSMTQERQELGDISKNSFIVYDITVDSVKVYCFQNRNDDWEIMELDAASPYTLSLTDPYTVVKCNVEENSTAPKGLEISEYHPDKDLSDLYYLFLNVVDCQDARVNISSYISKYNQTYTAHQIELCGIHHLYGKYDVLIKYRSKNGDQFHQKVIDYLVSQRNMLRRGNSSLHYFMNVSYENSHFKEIHEIPMLKNPEAYLNSTWNMATLTVYLNNKMAPQQFFDLLDDAIRKFNQQNNTKIDDIIRCYAIGQDQSIIFELFISCFQFPMLTRFTNLIEEIIREYGIDKSTHIIYYCDERRI